MKTTFQNAEDDLQGLVPVTQNDPLGQPKTTLAANRKRPSGSTGGVLPGQPKTTFGAKRRRPSGPIEDDRRSASREDVSLTLTSWEDDPHPSRRRPPELGRRPSTQAIGFRCSSTPDLPKVGPGSGLYPRSSTLVHDTSRPTGPSDPPLHQIMTTGTPLDPVVIRLRS